MGLKEIGKKIGDIAFKIAMSTCDRGGERGDCASCESYRRSLPSVLESRKASCEKKESK